MLNDFLSPTNEPNEQLPLSMSHINFIQHYLIHSCIVKEDFHKRNVFQAFSYSYNPCEYRDLEAGIYKNTIHSRFILQVLYLPLICTGKF